MTQSPHIDILIIPLLTALVVTLLATPLSLKLIKKMGLYDDPKTHKHPGILHSKPIPRGGGLPLFIGMIVAGIMFLPVTPVTLAIFASSLIALVTGILDDKFDISPYVRFAINIVCAIIVVGSGVSIAFITNPNGGILHLNALKTQLDLFGFQYVIHFSDIISVIWIVWVMNMLNWSKGVDGQMPGIVGISAIVIGLLSMRFASADQDTLIAARLSFIIAGASLGFLPFNFYPAKIFPGYGATSLYLLLAVVSILSSAKLATAILVMGVPMVDGMFTIGRRILSGKSPFWHDKKHLHHLLLRLGLNQRSIALSYWVFSAILGAISLTLSSQGKLFAIVMLAVIVGGALVFLHIFLEYADEEKTV